jgi:hypothetical protein
MVYPIATTLVVTALNVIRDDTQKILHVSLRVFRIPLTSQKLREEQFRRKRWRRWRIGFRVGLIVAGVVPTTATCTRTVATCLSGLISGTTGVRHLHISATSNY